MSKDILKDALEEILNESYEEMTGLDIPDYDFSDSFKEKMEKLTAVPEEKAEKKHRKIGWMAISALTAAAAAVCIWTGVKSTPKLEPKNSDTGNIITATEDSTGVTEVPGGIVRTTAPGTDIKYTVTTTAGSETPITSAEVINGNGNNTVNGGGSTYTRPSGKPAQTPKVTVTTARTSVQAAVTTVTSAHILPHVPEVTVPPDKPHSELDEQTADYERSIVMKKFLASAAAAATLMNVIPTGTQAAYEPPTVDHYMSEYIFPALEDGTVSPDINNDGVFDRYDIAALWSYVIRRVDYLPEGSRLVSDSDLELIAERGDIDQDYMIRMNDLLYFTRYYLYKNGVDPEDLDIYNYPDTNGNVTLTSFYFVDHLKTLAFSDNYLYKYASDLIKNENIDLDFNCDGKADIYDLFEYQMYTYSSYESPFNDSAAKKLVPISSITWDKCNEYHEKNFFDNRSDETLVRYYIFNTPFDADVLNYNNYYDYFNQLISQTSLTAAEKKDMGKSLKALPAAFSSNIKEAALEADLATVTSHSYKLDRQFDADYQDELDEAIADFEAKMLSGTVAPPDANLDGSCDMDDYKTILDFASDLERGNDATTSISLAPDIWDHLDNEFDLNNDGVSGDILDLQIAEAIITKYTNDDSVDLNALLDAFSSDSEAQAADKEAVATVNQIKYLEAFSGKTIERSGDADGDNQMKMNDAVLIMQTISNPDKYQLTTWGEFNSDVANTGDGITPMDALGIQNRLLKK